MEGNGTYAQLRLPMGVTADMVADRRDRLAANLGRAKLETWPTEGSEAGQLDLWIADKDALGRGPGRWPLLDDGQVDVFAGVPFGRSQRGQVVAAPILERNYVIGGQPGQGKSSAGRTLCLGCALDPAVELRVFVFAANPDFDPFARRLGPLRRPRARWGRCAGPGVGRGHEPSGDGEQAQAQAFGFVAGGGG